MTTLTDLSDGVAERRGAPRCWCARDQHIACLGDALTAQDARAVLNAALRGFGPTARPVPAGAASPAPTLHRS